MVSQIYTNGDTEIYIIIACSYIKSDLFANTSFVFQVSTMFHCWYCPNSTKLQRDIIKHLINEHTLQEIKFKRVDGEFVKVLDYKITPDMLSPPTFGNFGKFSLFYTEN